MYRGKVLFIDSADTSFTTRLRELGFECHYKDVNYEQMFDIAQDYVGYIIRSRFVIDKILIDASKQLKFIARIGAGMENIDVSYAQEKGISCINSPEGNADAVGEFVIGNLLALFRNTIPADNEVRNGEWLREENRGYEINGKTFGIIGYGNMGKSLAKKLSGFGCKVIAYDKFKKNFSDEFATEVSLKELISQANIVSVHINYTPENHYFINQAIFFSQLADPIFFVNTSRGKVLNTTDLLMAMNSGLVKGAVLDVLEYENTHLQNLPYEQWDRTMMNLAKNPDVILSPHIAGQTVESLTKHVDVLIDKLMQLPFMK